MPKTVTEDRLVGDLAGLAPLLRHPRHIGGWNLSQVLLQGIEEGCFVSPLDYIEFDPARRRYAYATEKNNDVYEDDDEYQMVQNDLTEDDFIFQAMVLWMIHALAHNQGVLTMLRQLSVWEGSLPAAEVDNLWADEIQELKQTPMAATATTNNSSEPLATTTANGKKMKKTTKPKSKKRSTPKLGKGLNHPDNFCTLVQCYAATFPRHDKPNRWCRRSDSQFNFVHLLAEQAVVQWALHTYPHTTTNGRQGRDLVAHFIGLQYKLSESPKVVPQLLLLQARRCYGEEDKFVRRALLALEEGDGLMMMMENNPGNGDISEDRDGNDRETQAAQEDDNKEEATENDAVTQTIQIPSFNNNNKKRLANPVTPSPAKRLAAESK